MQYILAIDQSTSATKALLYSTDGQVIDKESAEHKQYYPGPGLVEHDAEEIWQNTLSVARILLDRKPDTGENLVGISLSNQRETIIVFDRDTGEPLYPAMVWQCRRGSEICHQLEEAGHAPLVKQQTGLRLDTYFSASKLKWLIQKRPDIDEKLKQGKALIGTVDTYLIYRLTHGQVFATDHTNASRTLLYDIGRLQWSAELCDMFGVSIHSLPEVLESRAHFGETDLDGVLSFKIPICGVMGDSQASLFAQRCFEPGMAKVTFGTGSSVLLNIGSKPKRSGEGVVCTVAWVYNGKPTYCCEGIINYSAATLTWLKDQLGLFQSIRETETMALAVEDNGGVYVVPAFAGLSAPYWKPDARGAIVGLSGHSNKNHLVRAALESIAYQIRDVLDMIREDTGVSLRKIHGDGGPTRDRFLMQFTSDVLGIPLIAADVPDCSPLGAMMMGLLGLGFCTSLEELNELHSEHTVYEPALDTSIVSALYKGWKTAVKRVF